MGNNKLEGSASGGAGGKLTLTVSPYRPRRRAVRMMDKIGIDSDLNWREVIISGEKDRR